MTNKKWRRRPPAFRSEVVFWLWSWSHINCNDLFHFFFEKYTDVLSWWCWKLAEATDVVGRKDSPLPRPLVVDREDDLSCPPARLQEGVGSDDVSGCERHLVNITSRVSGINHSVSYGDLGKKYFCSLVFSDTVGAGRRGKVEVVFDQPDIQARSAQGGLSGLGLTWDRVTGRMRSNITVSLTGVLSRNVLLTTIWGTFTHLFLSCPPHWAVSSETVAPPVVRRRPLVEPPDYRGDTATHAGNYFIH